MPATDFDPEIYQDFLTECGELLEQLEGDLVELERTPQDDQLLNKVFRALHTIKGSASFLALTNLVTIAHAAETALNAARNHEFLVDNAAMNLLLAAVDTIKKQFVQIAAGQPLMTPEGSVVAALNQLGNPGGAKGGATGAAHAAPTPTVAAAPATNAPDPAAPARGGAPEAEPAWPRVTELRLEGARADLFEPFVADLERTLARIGDAVAGLRAEASRGSSGETLGELTNELATTVQFYELSSVERLLRAMAGASRTVDTLSQEAMDQVVPRLLGACELLGQQAVMLHEHKVVEWPIDTLAARIESFAGGRAPSTDAALPPNADAAAALEADGVLTREPAEPAQRPEGVPPAPAPGPAAPASAKTQPDKQPAEKAHADKHHDDAPDAQRGAAVPEQTIRVEVGRLERLMNLVGELVLQKNRIGALSRQLAAAGKLDADMAEHVEMAAGGLDRVTTDMQVAVMKTRMQPLEKLFGKYPRLIRDLATKTGKKIRLEVEGGETEVDKSVIEELGDPLIHLMRNSADHGIEMPDDRRAAGKDETGVIALRASHEGSHVRLRIMDDGRGLLRDRIAKKAIERGLTTDASVADMTDEQVFQFIMQPGFSTADQVSDLSGRGVGMDVVRTNIERIKGSLNLASEPGKGTTITITIPLTIAIMPAMMVALSGEIYAIPLDTIVEIVRPGDEQLSTIGEAPVVRLRNQVLPLIDGHRLFGVQRPDHSGPPFAVVLSRANRTIALEVTRVIGQQEIVIKPLDGVETSGPVSGATVRDDGGVSLIMDVAELVKRTR